MSVFGLLDQRVTITPRTAAPNGFGGHTYTDGTPVTGIRASVQMDDSKFGIDYLRETKRQMYMVFLLPSQAVAVTDKIAPTSGMYSGKVLEAFSAPVDQTGRGPNGTYRMVRATEVR